MDTLAHALWTGAAYKTINEKTKKPFRVGLVVFWGVFPDLFAFIPGFAWLFYNIAFGTLHFSDFPHPDAIEPAQPPLAHLTSVLYSVSHSAVVFFVVFGIALLILRRPAWELLAWLFHILLDIPTHSYRFYPTPFLWPLFGWKFNGFSWATPWFLVGNYTAIILVYLFLFFRHKKENGGKKMEATPTAMGSKDRALC